MFAPLVLVGCSKNYTVNIEVSTAGGSVFLKDEDGKVIIGRNTIKKGEKFEFFVKPVNGYQIENVVIDGEEQPHNYDVDGAYFNIEKVDKNQTVEVSFTAKYWTVTFEYLDGGIYKPYATRKVKHQSALDLSNDELKIDGAHWYAVLSGNKKYYLENGEDSYEKKPTLNGFIPYVFFISRDIEIRTDLSLEQLTALLG